jgi:hypothetical protein
MSLYHEFKNLSDHEIHKRILDMVDNQENEDQELDFKRIDSLDFLLKNVPDKSRMKCEFGKDLSAFTNATGGVIIYGIEEIIDPATGQRTMKDFGRGVNKVEFNRERLIQIANSSVSPSITNLDVKIINHPRYRDEHIIVVLIPESLNGAVMAEGDYRYYQRIVTENKPMRNWQVRTVNSKIVHPALLLNFDEKDGVFFGFKESRESQPSEFLLSIKMPRIKNCGKVIANQVGLVLRIPKLMYKFSNFKTDIYEEFINIEDNVNYIETLKIFEHPIFPGLEIDAFSLGKVLYFNFKREHILSPEYFGDKKNSIVFKIYADNATARVYRVMFDLSGIRTLEDFSKKGLFSPASPHDDHYFVEYYSELERAGILKIKSTESVISQIINMD